MRLFLVLALLCCAGTAAAAAADGSPSLSQLLEAVKQGRAQDAGQAAAREARFLGEAATRQQTLDAAKQELAVRTARAARLEQQYAANARRLEERRGQLQQRLLTLGDVFSHLRAVGVPVRDAFRASLSATQFGNERVTRLDRLLASTEHDEVLPAIEELENLWFEMQRELTAGGEIVRYPSQRFRPDGESEVNAVVRVGTFNIVDESGAYLRYVPARGVLVEPSLQPGTKTRDDAAALARARDGLHDFALDPSGPRGGELLDILTRRPGLWGRIGQGGWLGWTIMLLGLAGIAVGACAVLLRHAMRQASFRASPLALRMHEHAPRLLGIAAAILFGTGLIAAAHRGWQSASAAALGIGDARRLADALAGDFVVLLQAAVDALLLFLLRAWLLWDARDRGPTVPPEAGVD